MITVNEYIKATEEVKYLSVDECEVAMNIERHLLNVQRAKTNAKVVEALLA